MREINLTVNRIFSFVGLHLSSHSYLIKCSVWLFLIFAVCSSWGKDEIIAVSNPSIIPLTVANDVSVPKSYLGIHISRWKDKSSLGFDLRDFDGGYSQVSNAEVKIENGLPILVLPKGQTFYNYRKGVLVRLLGMGLNGADFEARVLAGTYGREGINAPRQYVQLSTVPVKLGICTIEYRPSVPQFNYGAVRSHGSGVKWSTLHLGKGVYNSRLMSDWLSRNRGRKIMFTMTDTPEWLATSNLMIESRLVVNNKVTLRHKVSISGVIPIGTKIKVRNCKNSVLNGTFVVSDSGSDFTSFEVPATSENLVADSETEVLIWGNNGGYGINNPPKDFNEVSNFITWMMKNYGDDITWIEGQNEANSSFAPNGFLYQGQGQSSWWLGTPNQLADIQKRIYKAAKAVKPSVQIGAPALTGLHTGQPIDASPKNRASQFQLLTASDGSGGKLADWIDFVPFHTYNYGASWQINGSEHKTLYNNLYYLKKMLAHPAINRSNIPIYMNEGGFEDNSASRKYFQSLSDNEQANEIFKMAAINAGFGVKGFYPWLSGYLGDYETNPKVAMAYEKIANRISGKTISSDSWFNVETGEMLFKTRDGYSEYIH